MEVHASTHDVIQLQILWCTYHHADTGTIIGGVVAIVFIVAVIIIAVVIIVVVVRAQRSGSTQNKYVMLTYPSLHAMVVLAGIDLYETE